MPWTAMTPAGSSIFHWRSITTVIHGTITPAIAPIRNAPVARADEDGSRSGTQGGHEMNRGSAGVVDEPEARQPAAPGPVHHHWDEESRSQRPDGQRHDQFRPFRQRRRDDASGDQNENQSL